MGLLRFQLFAVYGAAFFSCWYTLLQKKEELGMNATATFLVDFAPLWAIIAVGLYLLSVLIIGVLSFEDCPQAAKELDEEVKQAKVELKKRGII